MRNKGEFSDAMRWWVLQNKSKEPKSFDENRTLNWFSVILSPELISAENHATTENTIVSQLLEVFSWNKTSNWPQTYPVRLSMGAWNLRLPPALESELDPSQRLKEMAWMEEGSSFYVIPPSVLNYSIEKTDIASSKLRMYIGMTNLNSEIFTEGFLDALQYGNEGQIKF